MISALSVLGRSGKLRLSWRALLLLAVMIGSGSCTSISVAPTR